ncbi:MAG: hypothetical protein V4537_15060, partial [Pseudomonadota bacterium]
FYAHLPAPSITFCNFVTESDKDMRFQRLAPGRRSNFGFLSGFSPAESPANRRSNPLHPPRTACPRGTGRHRLIAQKPGLNI